MKGRAVTSQLSRSTLFTSIGFLVATLYFAKDVLIPIALSVLLAFLLAPLASRLERGRFGRIGSVLTVVLITFLGIAVLGWTVGSQVLRLANDLPRYEDEILRKVHVLRQASSPEGGLSGRLKNLGEEIGKEAAKDAVAITPATTQAGAAKPVTSVTPADVVAVDETTPVSPHGTPDNPLYTIPLAVPASPVQTLSNYLGLALGTLGTAALVLVLVIFILLEREDLRDRILRVVSRGKYTVSTKAVNDGASRISRYLVAQSIVNGSYGLTIGIGLWVIGFVWGNGTTFPSFVLWGFLCAALRFVPYVGPWVAALFPVAVSLAVYPGFSVFIAVAALIIVTEIISNNVVEPWLYGSSTGLSTVALLIAAVFWTWLWGPIGLMLSTPLTVCIVVAGKYVPELKFLDVLLGDRPALHPSVAYYQRLLAGDEVEANSLVRSHLATMKIEGVADRIILPALRRMRRDREEGGLTAETEGRILDATRRLIDDLGKNLDDKDEPVDGNSPPVDVAPVQNSMLVVGCPAHHRTEELSLTLLGLALRSEGIRFEATSTRMLPKEIEQLIGTTQPTAIFIAVQPPKGLVQTRYLSRRLRKRFKDIPILVGYWGRPRNFDQLLVRLRKAGASYVLTSIQQSRSQIAALHATRSAKREAEAVVAVQ